MAAAASIRGRSRAGRLMWRSTDSSVLLLNSLISALNHSDTPVPLGAPLKSIREAVSSANLAFSV